MRRRGLVGLGLVAAVLAVTSTAAAGVIHKPDGQFAGVMPRAASSLGARAAEGPKAALTGAPSDGNLDFHGGVVLHATRPYLIFWDPSTTITPGTKSVFESYLTDTSSAGLANSSVYAVGRQYTDAHGFADAGQTFTAADQARDDLQAFPVSSAKDCPPDGLSACVTDAGIQAELARFTQANGLPAGNGADAPVYFMVIPSDVNVCLSGGMCADTFFCAYHSHFSDATAGGQDVVYATIPLVDANKGCQADNTVPVQAPNGTQGTTVPDVAVDNMSHEYNEAITDPDGDGWWSDASGNEEADNCQSSGPIDDPLGGANPHAYAPTLGGAEASGDLFDQSIAGGSFYTQSEWSNSQADCFLQADGPPPAPAFTATAAGGDAITFDPSASIAASGFSSATWDFGDGSTSFAQGGPVPISHTYAGPGPEQVTLTLVDSTGSLATETRAIEVAPSPVVAAPSAPPPIAGNPTAVFSTSPRHPATGLPVHFNASRSTDTGAAITTYGWRFGDGGTGSGVRPSHTYRRPGRYTVTLTVTDSSGHSSSSSERLGLMRPGRISRLGLKRAGNGVRLTVRLSGPGTLQVGARRHRVTRARTLKIGLGLSRRQRRQLGQGRRVVYSVRLVFRPQAGATVRRTASLDL